MRDQSLLSLSTGRFTLLLYCKHLRRNCKWWTLRWCCLERIVSGFPLIAMRAQRFVVVIASLLLLSCGCCVGSDEVTEIVNDQTGKAPSGVQQDGGGSGDDQEGADCCPHKSAHHKGNTQEGGDRHQNNSCALVATLTYMCLD